MSDYGSNDYCGVTPDYEIDPDATVDFAINWSSWLDGDTIVTSVFLLPDGLTEVSSQHTDTVASIFVSGATRCRVYRITNRITTDVGRTMDKTIRVIGRDR